MADGEMSSEGSEINSLDNRLTLFFSSKTSESSNANDFSREEQLKLLHLVNLKIASMSNILLHLLEANDSGIMGSRCLEQVFLKITIPKQHCPTIRIDQI